MRNLIRLLSALALVSASPLPFAAQLYKWVDERGVTNYSNQPPIDAQPARKFAPVEDRVSVYSTDPALTQAIASLYQRPRRSESERIDRLERELAAERSARQYATTATVPSSCAGGDCYGYPGDYYPYVPVAGYFPLRNRFPVVPVVLPAQNRFPFPIPGPVTPGPTAGNVVGMSGYIPGMSASAPPGMLLPPSSFPPRPSPRGFSMR